MIEYFWSIFAEKWVWPKSSKVIRSSLKEKWSFSLIKRWISAVVQFQKIVFFMRKDGLAEFWRGKKKEMADKAGEVTLDRV